MWHLLVNILKTKLVVFRRGEIVKKNEKWYIGEEKIKIVPSYKFRLLFNFEVVFNKQ